MDKNTIIKDVIDPIVSLADRELQMFCDAFEVKKIKKNDYFLKQGEVCNCIGIVTKGIFLWIKTMDTNKELTVNFGFKGDWIMSTLSRLNNVPSLISIKAFENSELLVIKEQDLHDLYIQIPKIERIGRVFFEEAYAKLFLLTLDLQTHTAKERYENLLEKFPEIFEKVPLYHIANYLGIAPKSLCRIRKELLR